MNAEVKQQNVIGLDMDDNVNQFLTFMLAGEEYGVDILRVQEIKGWESATEIPNTPDYIEGVLNLRGTIVPIINLRSRFALERIDYSNTTVVIVLKIKADDKEKTIGFIVDAVSDVYNVTDDQMKPAPDFGNSVCTDFVSGLATVDEKMLILLDIDHLIDADIDVSQVVKAIKTETKTETETETETETTH